MQKKNKKKIEKAMELLCILTHNVRATDDPLIKELFEKAKDSLYTLKKSLSDRDREEITKAAKERDFDVLYQLVQNGLCTDPDLAKYTRLYRDYLNDDITSFRFRVFGNAPAYYELPNVMPLLHKIVDDNKENAIEYVGLLLKCYDIKSLDKAWADNSRKLHTYPLSIAVEKGNVEMVGTLLDAGAFEFYADAFKQTCHTVGIAIGKDNYDVVMAFMKRQKDFPNTCLCQPNMAKLLNVYGEPEKFLELACVPQDKLVYFKKAAMYGLLKRYYVLHADDVISKDKEEKYKENLTLIGQIKKKAKELEATFADANTLKEKLVNEAKTIAPEEFAPAAESTAKPTAVTQEKTK